MALNFLFLSIFRSFPVLHVNIKNCVGVFSGIFKARIMKLGIHMGNELLYCGIENRTHCSYYFLYCPFFCLLRLNLCQFSPKLCKLESSNMVYICRLSDYFVGLRLRVMALIFLFYLFFFLSQYYMLTLKFVSEFSQEFFKLEC